MTRSETADMTELLHRAEAGDRQALADAFARNRPRLKRMVRLRMDRRLQGRIDPSEVLQEAFAEVAKRADEYLHEPKMPFYLWLRSLTGQRLLVLHRQHLGAQARDGGQEVALYRGALPEATSTSLAAQLLGHLSSPGLAAQRAEMQLRLQDMLNTMDPVDREILALRHFEELTNNEVAEVLGLEPLKASNRYLRALKRLREMMNALPGFSRN